MENKMVSDEPESLSLHPHQIEVQRIKANCGSLDQIRIKLGMSRRQICKLLLVDPSAWTRWMKIDAPPHVYQALSWLLELKKTNPEAAGPVNLHTRVEKVEELFAVKVQTLEKQISHIENLFESLVVSQKYLSQQFQRQTDSSFALEKSETAKVPILKKRPKKRHNKKPLKRHKKKVVRKKAVKIRRSHKAIARKKKKLPIRRRLKTHRRKKRAARS